MKLQLPILLLFCYCLSGCARKNNSDVPPSSATTTPTITINMPADSIQFAAMGDYGDASENEAAVATLIKSLNPDFIITLGDNNYNFGSASTIVGNVGNFYCDFIYNFDAPPTQQCTGIATTEKINRFFPSIGNHDYNYNYAYQPYLDYFTLPGNEVYYDFIWGPVHFFALNSDASDKSVQQNWLAEKLAASQSVFKVVYCHHPPFSSGGHGNELSMQWNFEGVDLVMAGHNHIYERTRKIGEELPIYIVSGLGGGYKRTCNQTPLNLDEFTTFCYDENYGTSFISASTSTMKVQFVSIDNVVIDSFEIVK